jgi:hypothetical protein
MAMLSEFAGNHAMEASCRASIRSCGAASVKAKVEGVSSNAKAERRITTNAPQRKKIKKT